MPDDEDTGTRAFVPDFGDSEDSGEHSVPFKPNFDDTGTLPAKPSAAPEPAHEAEAPVEHAESVAASVHPVAVPGRYQYLKWWKLVLVILGVWIGAAEVGLSLFYWWYHTIDKTPAVFMVLVYVVACAVGGVMLAMVQGRPLISALSIAVMSGPFASVAAAAPLYGYYYCARAGHCLIGVIPY
ncbi:hypothetical protein [Mycobacterium shigaense]|uniref:Uncharacterized protein n=1 Tax=Mycobacterium shigaense TaxID=722731 RepID=A0A1Z4ED07_9MYCO|nr:hypothetical protein [Mycobacterium shigaense]MEA1122292.1 hypothetical protein [Mycobacterium shigaense]PRI16969.1 hypothetical protein B2J96_00380 [Mycobacterium shigaense]BAX90844.1 hypothetical protein MSG_00680 [Mycobacterium shigaense]